MTIKTMDNQISPLPPVPPASPPAGKSKDWLKILLIVVGLLVILGLYGNIYLLSRKEKEKPPAQIIPTPTQTVFLPTPTIDPTVNWRAYSNTDMFFKYPPDWTKTGYTISSINPKIEMVIVPRDSTLMNECMQEIATESKGGFVIKRFSRVTTGAMCATSDSTPQEIWIMPSATVYSPGISYQYLSTEKTQAEFIFDKILSTFKFFQ